MKGFLDLCRFLLSQDSSVGPSRLKLFLVVLASILSGLGSTALLALVNKALNAPLQTWFLMLFGALCVLVPASRVGSEYLLAQVSQGAIIDLRLYLSRRILAAPTRQLEALGGHRLIATLTDDVGNIAAVLTNVPIFCMYCAVVVTCLGYLAYLSPWIFGFVFGFTVLGMAAYVVPMRIATRRFRLARETWDALFKQLRALVDGNKELKLHRARRHDFYSHYLSPATHEMRRHNIAGVLSYSVGLSIGRILFFVLILLLVSGILVGADIDRSVLTGYTLVTLFLLTPLEVLMNQVPAFSRASVALRKIRELGLLLEREPQWERFGEEIADDEALTWNRIELRGVVHTYVAEDDADSFTMGPIDLAFEPGEVVFLVGGNGSGKTTLAKTLVGLYLSDEGEILWDGRRIEGRLRDEYRQLFSVVFNDFFLFETFMGLDRETVDVQAKHYLEELGLGDKVQVEGGRLSTLDLSAGQRKRLALLTAYLEDRPIYLFDEWAADQDPQFKEFFYRELLPALQARGKTVFAISHDDRYYPLADRLVRMENGRVVEDRRDYPADGDEPSVARPTLTVVGRPTVPETRAAAPRTAAGQIRGADGELPPALLERWMRDFYFACEADIGSSGVQDFPMSELWALLDLDPSDIDGVVFHDSQTLGGDGLRSAIAGRWLAGDESRVMATHGASEATFLLMHGLLRPGDEVVVTEPIYQQLYAIAEAIGCRIVHWPMRPENAFRPDLRELRSLVGPKTRLVVVNFPHNPTGVDLDPAERREVLEVVSRAGAHLLWDAAFGELTHDQPPLAPAEILAYERALVTGTLSKAYGLPGLRVGWCLAAPALLERMVHVRDYVTLHLSPLVELIAERAIRHGDRLVGLRLAQARSNLSYLERWVGEQDGAVEWYKPQGGVTAFPRLHGFEDTEPLCRRLANEHGVLLVPGNCFGHPAHVRLGFGGASRELEIGLTVLESCLDRAPVALDKA